MFGNCLEVNFNQKNNKMQRSDDLGGVVEIDSFETEIDKNGKIKKLKQLKTYMKNFMNITKGEKDLRITYLNTRLNIALQEESKGTWELIFTIDLLDDAFGGSTSYINGLKNDTDIQIQRWQHGHDQTQKIDEQLYKKFSFLINAVYKNSPEVKALVWKFKDFKDDKIFEKVINRTETGEFIQKLLKELFL